MANMNLQRDPSQPSSILVDDEAFRLLAQSMAQIQKVMDMHLKEEERGLQKVLRRMDDFQDVVEEALKSQQQTTSDLIQEALHGKREDFEGTLQRTLFLERQNNISVIQEVLQSHEERINNKIKEAVRETTSYMNENICRRPREIDERSVGGDRPESIQEDINNVGRNASDDLQLRIDSMETFIKRTLEYNFHRIETILKQLEKMYIPVSVTNSFTTPPSTTSNIISHPSISLIFPSPSPDFYNLSKATATPELLTAFQSEIWTSVEKGKTEMVQRLLDMGVDANLRNEDGKTLLHVACQRVLPDIVALLLSRGADVHVKNTSLGITPLHFAASDRSGHCVALLVGAGAEVNCRSLNGSTPLHWAACCNNEKAVRVLLASGACKSAEYNARSTAFDCTKDDVLREILRP